MANRWIICLVECLAVSRVSDTLSNVCFELQSNTQFNEFALYRAVLEVRREEHVGMDASLSLQNAIFDELNWYSYRMNYLLLLRVVCCVTLLTRISVPATTQHRLGCWFHRL